MHDLLDLLPTNEMNTIFTATRNNDRVFKKRNIHLILVLLNATVQYRVHTLEERIKYVHNMRIPWHLSTTNIWLLLLFIVFIRKCSWFYGIRDIYEFDSIIIMRCGVRPIVLFACMRSFSRSQKIISNIDYIRVNVVWIACERI